MDVILHKSTLLEKIRGESKGGVGLGITQELFIVFWFCISQDSLISDIYFFWCIVIFERVRWDDVPLRWMYQNLGQGIFNILKNFSSITNFLNDSLPLTSTFLSFPSLMLPTLRITELEGVRGVQDDEYVRSSKDFFWTVTWE